MQMIKSYKYSFESIDSMYNLNESKCYQNIPSWKCVNQLTLNMNMILIWMNIVTNWFRCGKFIVVDHLLTKDFFFFFSLKLKSV